MIKGSWIKFQVSSEKLKSSFLSFVLFKECCNSDIAKCPKMTKDKKDTWFFIIFLCVLKC